MTFPPISWEDAVLELKRLAEERPDYVYEKILVGNPTDRFDEDWQCRYLDLQGSPSCLVGHALTRLGIPLDVLGWYEERPALDLPPEWFDDSTVPALLSFAQNLQDSEHPWGESVEKAIECVNQRRDQPFYLD